MHIPDGLLDLRTSAGTVLLAGAGLVWSGRELKSRWHDRTTPLLGVMAAFVFAGQMVNFPIPGGTSGHLLGGALAATLLGPAAATLALTVVLMVQCLLFQDGGITALGANVLNLALIGVWSAHGVNRVVRRAVAGPRGIRLGTTIGGWVSVVLASAACAMELALAGLSPWRLVLPAMTITHAVIGVGEALITGAVVAFVMQVRPDLVYANTAPQRSSWKSFVLPGLAGSLGIAILLGPLASKLPDGLDRIVGQLGMVGRPVPAGSAPLADYTVPGVGSPWLAEIIAAFLGTVIAFALAVGLATIWVRWMHRSPSASRPQR